MRFEISSSESESGSDSEMDLRRSARQGTSGIQEDYSIDGLLEARGRKAFTTESRDYSVSEDEPYQFETPLDIQPFVCRKTTVYDRSQGTLPFSVFTIIRRAGPPNTLCFPRLQQWQWAALSRDVELIDTSATFVFSVIQELIVVRAPEIGYCLMKLVESMPIASINYEGWFCCLREAMFVAVDVVGFLLALSDFDKMAFTDDTETAKMEIMLLHISALLCPAVVEGPGYVYAARVLRKNLEWSGFSDAQIAELVWNCYLLAIDVPVKNLSLFASMLPMNGVGVRIMFDAAVRVCFFLLEGEVPENPDVPDLVEALAKLPLICDSSDDSKLLCVSALIALSERVFITALRLKLIGRETAVALVGCFKFSFGGADLSVLTELKEQMHVTRTQMELMIQSNMVPK